DVTLTNDSTVEVISGSLVLNGPIGGVGEFIKNGAGTLRLAGTNSNTYTAATRVLNGVLELSKSAPGIIALPAAVVIGTGTNPATVRCLSNSQFAPSAMVTVV